MFPKAAGRVSGKKKGRNNDEQFSSRGVEPDALIGSDSVFLPLPPAKARVLPLSVGMPTSFSLFSVALLLQPARALLSMHRRLDIA